METDSTVLRITGWRWLPVVLLASFLLAGCGRVIARSTPTAAVNSTDVTSTFIGLTATPFATATPAPYTPEPTGTPTITPTPVLYRVQSGDNLLTIAGRYGISVEAIRDANGIEDPRRLQIGQLLVIPMDEEARAGLEPTPTPTPMPLEVANLIVSHTRTGGLWCLGTVRNTSGMALEQIQVEVRLLDGEEQVVASLAGSVALDLVAPDESAPFALLFSDAPSGFASYQVLPLSAVPAYIGSYYRDLDVRNTSGEGERQQAYRVQGEVVNVGPEEAVDVYVIVTVYDALGRVVGVRRAPPEHNVIPVGGHTPFEISLSPVAGPVVTYTVQTQGRRILPNITP